MPIMVKVVSKADFAAWTETAKEEFALIDAPGNRTKVADADGAAHFAQ
jgi:heme/copper-type cytochrome/quinol oxidase subunit 2